MLSRHRNSCGVSVRIRIPERRRRSVVIVACVGVAVGVGIDGEDVFLDVDVDVFGEGCGGDDVGVLVMYGRMSFGANISGNAPRQLNRPSVKNAHLMNVPGAFGSMSTGGSLKVIDL